MPEGRDDWNELTLDDLLFAFRKAKVDCFYESSIRVAEQFVDYEQGLADRLTRLLARLQQGEAADVLREGTRPPIIFPKRLHAVPDKDQAPVAHAFFSDAERAFGHIDDGRTLIPEFRLIGDFSVECHIVSALWVNLIGHKFDARLSPRALAARVRRYRATKSPRRPGGYHREAVGSFEPYFTPYRRWRDDGIRAMRESVAKDESIIAMTLDVGNFYHSIDPKFFVDPAFLAYLKLDLTAWEVAFSTVLAEALSDWSAQCRGLLERYGCRAEAGHGGIPIGLSIVRIISNVVLAFLDEQIEQQLSPLYYARYVDDLFLVLRDTADIASSDALWAFITRRLPALRRKEDGDIALDLPPEWGAGTHLTLQASKQKTFFLSGRSGADLLEHIAVQIREVSSERRTMPLPEQLGKSHAARALAATTSAETADSLRRADGLTLRRLGWSVMLRTVNTLARDLDPSAWIEQRNDFYEFAHEHVIRPDKILEQIDHLPRLLSLAVALQDWKQARRIYQRTVAAIYELQAKTAASPLRLNGVEATDPDAATRQEIWGATREQVRRFFREALIRAYPLPAAIPRARAFAGLAADLELSTDELTDRALRTREADWARSAYREHLRTVATRHAPAQAGEGALVARYPGLDMLRTFLKASVRGAKFPVRRRVAPTVPPEPAGAASLLPFVFPIRPYTAEEIALYLPDECIFGEPVTAANTWADYTRAVRGVWVRSALAEDFLPQADGGMQPPPEADGGAGDGSWYDGGARIPPIGGAGAGGGGGPSGGPPPIVVNRATPTRLVRLGLTSFATSDDTWARGAAGQPDLSLERYSRLSRLVNAAITADPKPDYLLLPELAIPERWIATIAGLLLDSRISLIAGVDYTLYDPDWIDSSAVLVLTDDRLGYPSAIQVWQRKVQPAPQEEHHLFASHGRKWTETAVVPKRVYRHNGLHLGVLVCSELQNMTYRAAFQGAIDCLITLAWNKDLESFSALVDAAALDVHCYVALVNNRNYGDSRLRRPAKQAYERDLCRVRGGRNDQLVIEEIEPSRLRAQQSRARRWPRPEDRYKPAPEGFTISTPRKTIPD